MKCKNGWLYAVILTFIFSLAVSGASPSYRLMEIRQDKTGKSVTLVSKIPRLSGLKDSGEQAKRNTEFQEESQKALIWTQMYRAKAGTETASSEQHYTVSFANDACLSLVFQTDFHASGSSAHFKQGHTIRLSDAKSLSFSDLFASESRYLQTVEQMVQQALGDPTFHLTPRQSYYLTDQAVVVLVGSVSEFSQREIPLEKDRLKGLLKPEFC